MKVVTAEQIRALDKRAIEEAGIPGVVLMENAGRAVVTVMEREYGPLQGKRVAVFCGSGNNGGDGFVIARHLFLAGALPWICMAGNPETLKADAAVHYSLLLRLAQQRSLPWYSVDDVRWRRELAEATDLVVDALLGTGIQDAPRESYAGAIESINRSGQPVIAVDVPSGVNSDTGATPGAAIRATHTVTFAYPKLGLYLFPGAECVGALHVSDIGFDWEPWSGEMDRYVLPKPFTAKNKAGSAGVGTLSVDSPRRTLLEEVDWSRLLRRRPLNANKGDFGHVAVIGGSQGMAGAPSLVARGAQRAGAGLVTVLAPACVQPAIGAKLDEQMTLALPDVEGAASEAAYETIAEFAEKATVLCIGPGMTTHPETVALIQRVLAELNKPIILDADGLNALAKKPDIIDRRPADPRSPLVLTPHPGEAARLLGTSIAEVESDRVGAALRLARQFRAIVVLKGRFSLIADPEGAVFINTSGNPGMATGGSGDTLTGIVGAVVAQALAPGKSARDEADWKIKTVAPLSSVTLAVSIHGTAGDLAAAAQGEVGLVAGDMIAHLPAAIRLLEELS